MKARARRPPPPAPDTDVVQSDDASDRQRLVKACIETLDVATTDAVRELMRHALDDVGVVPVHADDESFDSTRHRAVDVVPTTKALLHNRVSLTERPGYTDHGALIRPPDVVVYRLEQRP